MDASDPVQLSIDPHGGCYTEPLSVKITCTDPDVEIRYTTSFYERPTASSPLYQEPLELSGKSFVRAQVFKGDQAEGEVAVAAFDFFDPDTMLAEYDWQPQPDKAALMVVFAHPDDEAVPFRGALPYYGKVRGLPIVSICMSNQDTVKKCQMRRKELEAAMWAYGIRTKPLYGNFPDDCYGQPISDCLDSWGMANTVRYITEQVRRYKPEVVLTHDFYGEYGHPNHIVTAMACFDAHKMANDPRRFADQVEELGLWQPKKLYAHKAHQNSWEHRWDDAYPELGGKTPQEVADEGIRCHVSQRAGFVDYQGRDFGLILSEAGPDVRTGDFFENIPGLSAMA